MIADSAGQGGWGTADRSARDQKILEQQIMRFLSYIFFVGLC